MSERRRPRSRLRALPYPTPSSDRCQELMLGVIKGLGKLPNDDDGIEDRVLACLLVAVIFLMGLSWWTWWPTFLILGGLSLLMSGGRLR